MRLRRLLQKPRRNDLLHHVVKQALGIVIAQGLLRLRHPPEGISMSVEASIHAALEAHLRAFAEPRSIRVARQGFAFTPPAGAAYLRTSFLPNRSADNPIRDEDQPARMGLFQVSVVSPPDRGLTEALTLSGQIIEHFRRARLPATGWLVRVTEAPWASPPMQDSDRLQVPVTIPWVATPQ